MQQKEFLIQLWDTYRRQFELSKNPIDIAVKNQLTEFFKTSLFQSKEAATLPLVATIHQGIARQHDTSNDAVVRIAFVAELDAFLAQEKQQLENKEEEEVKSTRSSSTSIAMRTLSSKKSYAKPLDLTALKRLENMSNNQLYGEILRNKITHTSHYKKHFDLLETLYQKLLNGLRPLFFGTEVDIHTLTGTWQYSALTLAAMFNREDEAEKLLKNNVSNPLHFDEEYYSPLYWGIVNENEAMVSLLLSYAGTQKPSERCVLEAVTRGNQRLTNLLLEAGAVITQNLSQAALAFQVSLPKQTSAQPEIKHQPAAKMTR